MISDQSTSYEDYELINKLEEISLKRDDRIIRLKGIVYNKNGKTEDLEIMIFRGYSSCTTHPTNNNPDESILPNGSKIISAEVLKFPFNPSKETILLGPIRAELILNQNDY